MGELHQLRKASVAKVDAALGLVCGWGIICCEKNAAGDWEDHYDLQGDHISEDVMMKAVADFMLSSREAHDMHTGNRIGTVVESFALTKDIAEAYEIQTDKTGWMIKMRPSPDILAKYVDGTYTGFSIGGACSYELEEAA